MLTIDSNRRRKPWLEENIHWREPEISESHGGGELEVHGVADLDAVVLLVVGAVLDGLLDL